MGAAYDWIFFLGSPLIALVIGYALFRVGRDRGEVVVYGRWRWSIFALLVGQVTTHAHIFLVFFRSHLRREIFRRYPWRFTLVPAVAFLAMMTSGEALVVMSVLAYYWDFYHSSLQTFGLARIYDKRAGNGAEVGRRLDIWLNLFLYVGPALAGVNFLEAANQLALFKASAWFAAFAQFPSFAARHALGVRYVVLSTGIAFSAIYLVAFLQSGKRGYRVAAPKVMLLLITGAVSIYAWGFLPPLVAVFVMNLFHAVQYFAIVWWSERESLLRRFRLGSGAWGALALFVAMFGLAYGYGCLRTLIDEYRLAYAIITTGSLMHFWYDGFIWSVRRNEV